MDYQDINTNTHEKIDKDILRAEGYLFSQELMGKTTVTHPKGEYFKKDDYGEIVPIEDK